MPFSAFTFVMMSKLVALYALLLVFSVPTDAGKCLCDREGHCTGACHTTTYKLGYVERDVASPDSDAGPHGRPSVSSLV